MPDLYPTLDRRSLLRSIDSGRVRRDDHGHLVRYSRDFKSRVDAKVREMVRAGWLTETDDGQRPLALTAAGRTAMGQS